MSRIHEALKKAEQERSTTPGTEIGPSPQEPVIIPAPASEGRSLGPGERSSVGHSRSIKFVGNLS